MFSSLNSELPDDVLRGILLRLPVKSLIRFKSVCKEWRSFISSSHFVKHHLSYVSQDQFYNKQRLAITYSFRNLVSADLQLQDLNAAGVTGQGHSLQSRHSPFVISIIGTSNGLLCVEIFDKSLDLLEGVALWLPSTREFNKIPTPTPPITDAEYLESCFGFGYDSLNDDYKVLRIHGFDFENHFDHITAPLEYHVDIYSLKSNYWKVLNDHNLTQEIISRIQTNSPQNLSINLDGFVYRPYIFCHSDFSTTQDNILGFDLTNEKFVLENFLIPSNYKLFYSDVFRGCLAFCLTHLNPSLVMDVWVMEKRQWVKLMTFPYYGNLYRGSNHLVSMKVGAVGLCRLVCFSESDGSEDDFVLYCVCSQSFESFVHPRFRNKNSLPIAGRSFYIETLISPHPVQLNLRTDGDTDFSYIKFSNHERLYQEILFLRFVISLLLQLL